MIYAVRRSLAALRPRLFDVRTEDEDLFALCPVCRCRSLKLAADTPQTTLIACTTCGLQRGKQELLDALQLTEADLITQETPPPESPTGQGRMEETPEWEPVVAFGTHALPTFPTAALPTWVRAFVEAETLHAETPPDLPAVLTLAGLATAVAGKARINPAPGWYEPLNLFCLVAMPPASRKSAVFSAVNRPLIEYERQENERMGPLVAQAQTDRDILKARIEEAKKKAATATNGDSRDEYADKARSLTEQLTTQALPSLLRLFADDCTLEKLTSLMSEQQGRMAVLSSEGGLFGVLAGRYSEKGANLDAVLKGHAGDCLRVDRVGRTAEYVQNPTLTLGLAVQPDVLRGLVQEPGFRGRGLLARFLYSLPASNVGSRPNHNPPVPEEDAHNYQAALQRLLALPVPTDEMGQPRPPVLTFTPEAAAGFAEFRNLVEAELRPGGLLHDIEDWGGKFAGAVARISGILHMAERGDTERTITAHTLQSAIKIGQYFAAHARAAFDLMGADAAMDDARCVLAWLQRKGLDTFTRRDAHHALQSRFQRKEPLITALGILEERHYIREREAKERAVTGRKPGPIYEVNPALQNIQNIQNTV